MLSRFAPLFVLLVAFALLNTSLLSLLILGVSLSAPTPPPIGSHPSNNWVGTLVDSLLALQARSTILTPITWAAVVGAWVWRGRTKTAWTRLGLSKNTFKLLTRMKGSQTRVSILRAVLTPKDRLQLAKELNLDWTTIDYHVRVLLKYGLIYERSAYGKVKLYELTGTGTVLLKALEELNNRSANISNQAAAEGRQPAGGSTQK